MKETIKKIFNTVRGFVFTVLGVWFLYFGVFMSICFLYFLIFNPITFKWYVSWGFAILSTLISIGIIKYDNKS